MLLEAKDEEGKQDRDKDKTSAVRDKLNKRSQQQPEGGGRRAEDVEVLGLPTIRRTRTMALTMFST